MNNSPSKHRKVIGEPKITEAELQNSRALKDIKCSAVTTVDGVPENSPFRVTKESKAYDVKDPVDCWLPHCRERNNRATFIECGHILATGSLPQYPLTQRLNKGAQ